MSSPAEGFLSAIGRITGNKNLVDDTPESLSRDEDLAVRTVIGEAKGQPEKGLKAVAGVIRNRANQSGQSFSDVVLAPNQFEPWSSRRKELEGYDPNSPTYRQIARTVLPVLRGQETDPAGGADHFYAPVAQSALGRAKPSWDNGSGVDIGGHRFFKLGYTGSGKSSSPTSVSAPNTFLDGLTAITNKTYDSSPDFLSKIQQITNPSGGGVNPVKPNVQAEAPVTSLDTQTAVTPHPPVQTPQNAPVPQQPIPEHPDTLQAQLTSALDPKSPRAAVLTTSQDQNTIFSNQDGFTAIPFKKDGYDGTLWVNNAKAKKLKLRTSQDIQQFVEANPDAMTRLIGKVNNVGGNTSGGLAVSTVQKGVPVSDSVVTSPESAQRQASVDQQAFPGSTSTLMPTEQAAQNRADPVYNLGDTAGGQVAGKKPLQGKQPQGKGHTAVSIGEQDLDPDTGQPIQPAPLPTQQVNARDESAVNDAIAYHFTIPDSIKGKDATTAYVRGHLQAQYPNGDFSNFVPASGEFRSGEAGVSFGQLKNAGVDTAPIVRQKVVENRVENPQPDLRPVPYDFAKTTADDLNNVSDKIFGSKVPARVFASGLSGLSEILPAYTAFALRAGGAGVQDEILSNGGSKNVDTPYSRTIGRMREFVDNLDEFHQASGDPNSPLTFVADMAGQAPKFAVMSALPGGLILGLAMDRGGMGTIHGSNPYEFIGHTVRGASEGTIFEAMPWAKDVLPFKSNLLKAGIEAPILGGAVYGLGAISGDKPEDNLLNAGAIAIAHLLTHGGGAAWNGLKGKVFHGRDAEGNEVYQKVTGTEDKPTYTTVAPQDANFEFAMPKPKFQTTEGKDVGAKREPHPTEYLNKTIELPRPATGQIEPYTIEAWDAEKDEYTVSPINEPDKIATLAGQDVRNHFEGEASLRPESKLPPTHTDPERRDVNINSNTVTWTDGTERQIPTTDIERDFKARPQEPPAENQATKRASITVPETGGEQEGQGLTALEEIRQKGADTTAKIQALFPDAHLTRQQAADLRRQAFPDDVDKEQPNFGSGESINQGDYLGTPPEVKTSETAPTVAPETKTTAETPQRAKTVAPKGIATVPTSDLSLDPERFQYKLNKDSKGSTGSLEGVKSWNPHFAGVIDVWKDPSDGKTYVVNGHNRYNKAIELGQKNINVQYIDAPDAKSARAAGAKSNIADGKGTPIDAAQYLKDSGESVDDLKSQGLPLSGDVAKKGIALSKLNDFVFNAVRRGELPENQGVAIGNKIANHDLQNQAFKALVKTNEKKTPSQGVVNEMLDAITDVPKNTETERTLFGDFETEKSLFAERAQAAASIKQRLSGDKTLFGLAARKSDRLAEGGTKVDVEQAKQLRNSADEALTIFDNLKNRSGEISDILDDNAKRIANGEPSDKVTKGSYERIRQAVKNAIKGGVEADDRRSDAPVKPPESKTSQPSLVEPTSKTAETPRPEAKASPQAESVAASKVAEPAAEPVEASDPFEQELTKYQNTKESAKTALESTVKGIDSVRQGLGKLFDPEKFKGGGFPAFDEKTYAAAKPHFEEALSHFKQAATDSATTIKNLIEFLGEKAGMSIDAIRNMRPYIERFAKEVEGKGDEPPTGEAETPKPKERGLAKSLEAAQLEKGEHPMYVPERIAEDQATGRAIIAEKGIDGAREAVLSRSIIPNTDWAPTGFAVMEHQRAEIAKIRQSDPAKATELYKQHQQFIDDFTRLATENGQMSAGIRAIREFAPSKLEYFANKLSQKGRGKPLSHSESSMMTELGTLIERERNRQKGLDEQIDKSIQESEKKASNLPKKETYLTKLEKTSENAKQTILSLGRKLDLSDLLKTKRFEGQRGAIGEKPQLPGDAELLAEYAAGRLHKVNTVEALNKELTDTFGKDIESILPDIRKRAYELRQDAHIAALESKDTTNPERRTILQDIRKEITDAANEAKAERDAILKEAKDAQAEAEKAQKEAIRTGRKEQVSAARQQAKAAKAAERAADKAYKVEEKARAKEYAKTLADAKAAERKGFLAERKANKEKTRQEAFWDTPTRKLADEARGRLKTAEPNNPDTMTDLASVGAAKFLPEKAGGVPRKGNITPTAFYREMQAEFPDLVTNKNKKEVYKQSYQRIVDTTVTAREAAKIASASTEVSRLWKEEGIDENTQALLIQKAASVRRDMQYRNSAAQEFNRVSRPWYKVAASEVWHSPRALMTSLNIHQGRQGLMTLLSHPLSITLKTSVPQSLKGLAASPAEFLRLTHELKDSPGYGLFDRSGGNLAELPGTSTTPAGFLEEDQLQSRWAQKLPWVRRSTQGFILGMNSERLALFNKWATIGEAYGYTEASHPEFFKAIAKLANDFTGRGKAPDAIERFINTPVVNEMFFAPRLKISQVMALNDLFNPLNYFGKRALDPALRKIKAQEALRVAAGFATLYSTMILMGGQGTDDPDNPDIFKIKFGDTHYDLSGGVGGTLTFGYKFFKSIYDYQQGHYQTEYQKPLSLAGQFLRKKLGPWPGAVVDYFDKKNVVGQPSNLNFRVKDTANKLAAGNFTQARSDAAQTMKENIMVKMVLPLIVNEIMEGVEDDGWRGVAKTAPASAFGFTEQTYKSTRVTNPNSIINREKVANLFK